MADPEHLRIVKQGAAAIAEWHESHAGEFMDLSRADLTRANLRRADLRRANLRRAQLRGAYLIEANLEGARLIEADLSRADLNRADLNGAHLSEADLSRADLNRADLNGANLSRADLSRANLSLAGLHRANIRRADFSGADLSGVDLTEADLSRADLRSADLSGADLTYTNLVGAALKDANLASARLLETVFGDTDLSQTKGLDSIRHHGPSVIDERTLRKSWPLPEAFLRGCGLSDQYIAYLPSLMGQAIEFYSCFISYSSKDDEFAKRLHADLQENGVRCWFAPEDMKIGARLRPGIDEAIRLHDKLLLILSKDSVQSPWVESEVEAALERERRTKRMVLFPIRIDDAVMRTRRAWAAEIRRTRHIGDFRRWKEHDAYHEAFERLLLDLKAEEKQRAT